MRRKRRIGKPFSFRVGEGEAEWLIEQLVKEVRSERSDDERISDIRGALLDLGKVYVPAMVRRVRECTPQESLSLACVICMMGDPRLMPALKELVKDVELPGHARMTAFLALRSCGVEVELPPDFPPPSEEEVLGSRKGFADFAAHVQHGEEIADIATQLERATPEERAMVLEGLACELGQELLPLFARLGQHPNSGVATAAVRALGFINHPKAIHFLEEIAWSTAEEKVRSAALDSLINLRDAGVPDPQPHEREPLPSLPPISTNVWDAQRACLTVCDGIGSRLMFLARRRAMHENRWDWIHLCINDVVGIKDCASMECDNEEILDLFQNVFAMADARSLPVAEIDPHYALWLLQEARERNRATEFPLPWVWAVHLEGMEFPPMHFPRPIIYQLVEENSIRRQKGLLKKSEELIDEPGFGSWLIQFDEMKGYAERALQRSQQFRGGQFGIVGIMPECEVEEIADTIFTPERKAIFKRRLEEAAYIFWCLKKRKVARQCVAVALALEQNDLPPYEIPFLHRVVRESLSAALAALRGNFDPQAINASPYDPIR